MTTAPPLPLTPVNAAMQEALLVDSGTRTEVLLVRHGQQHYAGDAVARALAQDPPLSRTGRMQASLLGQQLAGEGLAAVYSSRLQRAQETAQLLRAELPTAPAGGVVDGLHEVELYRHVPQDKSVDEVLSPEQLRAAGEAFRRTRQFGSFPTGESSEELRARAVAAIGKLVSRHHGERFAIVGHGGLMNAFLAHVLGLEADMFFFPAHASVTRALTRDDRWAVRSVNETGHLADLVTH